MLSSGMIYLISTTVHDKAEQQTAHPQLKTKLFFWSKIVKSTVEINLKCG